MMLHHADAKKLTQYLPITFNTTLRGTWGGSEHRNTAKKINEHRITARKVNETPSPQHPFRSFTLKIILLYSQQFSTE